MNQKGTVYRVSGPVVTAVGIRPAMYDIVRVGTERLMGEVIQIEGEKSIIQVYEDTSGVKPGEPVENTGLPLVVELGPGLLTSIYDGIQRPLEVLQAKMGHFILRGVDVPGLDHQKKWDFKPGVKKGDKVVPGQVLGTVQESPSILHKVMLPPNVKAGTVKEVKAGPSTIDEAVVTLEDGTKVAMHHKWPVRKARPYKVKQLPTIPLNTGMRILDGLFPIAKGGTAAIPGPFG
ncbi:MAG TPA: V-type ATP synthase subunit A, partial [Candidatus Thermoplasmatota archaeon]|nr:V-type ATP synthase subunit A [Candidatus Thermoplasmatota archaeon]